MSCYGGTALALSIFTVVTGILAFVLPLWLQSWEQKQSTFTRIGLWEVCFTAFSDPKLYAYKYYSGCWWIFHPEVDAIRDMLNPAWFKAVQGFAVCTLLSSFVTAFFLLVGRCQSSLRTCGDYGGAVFSLCTAICGLICVIVFGACAKDPRLYRLPMPQYNYFGAGYGLMIICTLSAGFCVAFAIGDAFSHKEKVKKYKQ